MEVMGIAALLNSDLFDNYFRTFNGNVNVSATELREMPMQETGTGRFPYYQRKQSPHLRRVVQRLQMGLSEKISS